MKNRRVGVDGVAVLPRALALGIVSQRDGSSSDQASTDQAPTLPDELIEEILLRVSPDEPAHLARAAIVCKAWQSILSTETFRHRYSRFHRTPNLQGYFYNDFEDLTIRFVPTTSTPLSPLCVPKVDKSRSRTSSVLDCRHGRVLIHQAEDCSGSMNMNRLIVWDPLSGSQQHLREPDYPQYPYPYKYSVAAVLCGKKDCDHLNCHGGPFLVVFVVSGYDSYNYDGEVWQTWATVYSSETGAWSASLTPYVRTCKRIHMTPSVLIGDALYFNTVLGGYSVVKYDLCKHDLSVIHLPVDFEPILIKGPDGGLGLATILHNCINTVSSWQVDTNCDGGSLKYKVLKLRDTLLPEDYDTKDLICMAERTNIVFIHIKKAGLFTLDLKSRQVRKVGETKTRSRIYPFVCFYTPKY